MRHPPAEAAQRAVAAENAAGRRQGPERPVEEKCAASGRTTCRGDPMNEVVIGGPEAFVSSITLAEIQRSETVAPGLLDDVLREKPAGGELSECQVECGPFVIEIVPGNGGDDEGGVLRVDAQDPHADEARPGDRENKIAPTVVEEDGGAAAAHPTVILDVRDAIHDGIIDVAAVKTLDMKIMFAPGKPLEAAKVISGLRRMPVPKIRGEG